MSCAECTARRIRAHSDQWRNAEREADVVRLLWIISLSLFTFCVTWTHPWVQ